MRAYNWKEAVLYGWDGGWPGARRITATVKTNRPVWLNILTGEYIGRNGTKKEFAIEALTAWCEERPFAAAASNAA